MALFCPCVSVMTVSLRAHYQDPETEAATWNSAVIHFIIYTCAIPTYSAL